MSTTETYTSRGSWEIDSAHTSVDFAVKHMMITMVRGRFGQIEGSIVSTDDLSNDWTVDVKIDAGSIDTRSDQRDAHLRSADFLDAENHPDLTFRGRGVRGEFAKPGDRFTVEGDLTIRGVTRTVELDVAFDGQGEDPWGGERMSFTASTRIDRRDFGLTWNQALEAGGVLVANEVAITLDVQLVKKL